ncbi:transglutaminaseTgpA domain-containing protein [Actinoplanes sp. NPDC049265]|uniref:transglutaminaseTgpA domain-containing protein n=1 Tax=Actinoplanes sp. NPDC049265 TaxID=3363902 RepID=UPI00371B2158
MRPGPLHQAEIALGAVAVAAAAPVYGDFFVGRSYLPPLLIAAAGGATIAVLAALVRLRAVITAVVTVAGSALVLVYAVLPGTLRHGVPTGETLRTAGTGITTGWVRMLTVGLPADVRGELLITPALMLYVCGFAAAMLTLRTRRLLAPAAVPPIALTAALLLTAGRAGGALPVAAVMLLASLVQILVRAVRLEGVTQGARLAGRALFGLPVVAAVAAAGVAFAAVVPIAGSDRFDPRELVPVPLDIEDTLNPLAVLKSQLREPSRDLFTVRVRAIDETRPIKVDRVRTAALDTYDGAQWTSSDRFLLAGRELATDLPLRDAARVDLHVEIHQLDAPYLPAIGQPERITATDVGYAAGSGVLAAAPAVRPGLTYDLVAAVRPVDRAKVTAKPFVPSPAYTELPAGFPVELSQQATISTAAATDDYGKLEALEKRLRGLRYNLASPPGHSLDRLRRLFVPGESGTGGYGEQYVAAFVAMARSLGYPARVATGYRLRKPSAGVYTVRSRDAFAWAEVSMDGYGWMSFDPVDPANRNGPPPPPDKPVKPDQSGSTGGTTTPTVVVRPDLTIPAGLSGWDWTLLVLAGVVLLAIVLPAAVVAEKHRRTRRRRRGTPAQRIGGAWRECTDRLREAGLAVSRSWTVLETAEQARRRLGDTAAAVVALAPLVGAALYAAEPPGADSADEAWRADSALRAALRRRRGLRATVAAWLDPRPILIRDRGR